MIQLIGDITLEAFKEFSLTMTKLERAKVKKVYIKLMSDGGDAEVGLAFYDRIRLSPLEVNITAYGLVGSAAALVFLAGDYRVMTPNSWLFVHEEETSGVDDRPLSSAKRTLERLQEVDDQYNRLMASRCDMSIADWEHCNQTEAYLSPKFCKLQGICHRIL